jgi:hypothetical protein
MMIDMNGPSIEAVGEVKEVILESVNVWKQYKKRVPSRVSSCLHNEECLLSTLGTYVVLNDLLKDDFTAQCLGQVGTG